MPYDPRMIHPDKLKAIKAGHAAFPDSKDGKSFAELTADKRIGKIVDKYERYSGVELTHDNIMSEMLSAHELLNTIAIAEANHIDELEKLAVELVFMLPEFSIFKAPYQKGHFKIDAKITGDMSQIATALKGGGADSRDDQESEDRAEEIDMDDPEVSDEAFQAHDAQQTFDTAVSRRRLSNALIQGGAVSNNYAFELGGPELDAIDDELRELYGMFITSSDIVQWIAPDSAAAQALESGMAAGSSEVQNDGGVLTIKAYGVNFPVVIQELIKGLLEMSSLPSIQADDDMRERVHSQTDVVEEESWSMMLGPQLWEAFLEAVDADSERELAIHLYHAVQHLEDYEFQEFMREIWAKSEKGRKNLRDLATKVKASMEEDSREEDYQDGDFSPESYGESKADSVVSDLLTTPGKLTEDELRSHVHLTMLEYLSTGLINEATITQVIHASKGKGIDTVALLECMAESGLDTLESLMIKFNSSENLGE